MLRERGLSYREIGILIAKQDGRKMPYLALSVAGALRNFHRGNRDEDGEREFERATARQTKSVSLGDGIGIIIFRK
jgi:hypothetical protein